MQNDLFISIPNIKMKIICAGLYKTGTKSLAWALRHLGYSVHDSQDHWDHNLDNYIHAYQGKLPDFAAMYKDVDAVTDLPPCHHVKDIFKAFPRAKVILTVRDSKDVWAKSLSDSLGLWYEVYDQPWLKLARRVTPTGRKWCKLISLQVPVIAACDYDDHNESVKHLVPADQLLVYNLNEGWEPLCKILGHDVPEVPFPKLNKKSSYIPDLINTAPITERMWRELLLIGSAAFLFIAFCVVQVTLLVG